MAQRFYQKPSVQAAIIIAIAGVVGTIITIAHERSQLKIENEELRVKATNMAAEIQRLETLLILLPLRSIQETKRSLFVSLLIT